MQTPSRMRPRSFQFDRVFGPKATQLDVFSQVRPLVESVLAGYNATVLAYGSTGSGKTHTIMGCSGTDPALSPDDPRVLQAQAAAGHQSAGMSAALPGAGSGVLQRTLQTVFARASERPDMRYSVELSYVELYKNSFKDLLADSPAFVAASAAAAGVSMDLGQASKGPKISIRESRSQGVYLEGSATLRQAVETAEEALALIARGNKNRATGCTNLNEHSSRSHAIIALDVVGERVDGSDAGAAPSSASSSGPASARKRNPRRHGRLFVVDLAGSERLSMSGALEDDRLMGEAQAINLSLTVLADVLSALATKSRDAWVVPYRNSKLTHLLRDSLGGSARTVMLVHARCTQAHYRQTLTSLMYAERARAIRNSVTSHLEGVPDAGEEARRARELEELRCAVDSKTMELQAARAAKEAATAENARLQARIDDLIHQSAGKEQELIAAIDAARAGIVAATPPGKSKQRQVALAQDVGVAAARKSPAAVAASSSAGSSSPAIKPASTVADAGILTSPALAGPSAMELDQARESAAAQARTQAQEALKAEQEQAQARIDKLLLEIRQASVNAEKAAAAGEARGRAAAEAQQEQIMEDLRAELETTKEQAEPELLGRLQRALDDAKFARQKHAEAVEQMDEAVRTHDLEQKRAREAQEALRQDMQQLHEAHEQEKVAAERKRAIDAYYASRDRTDAALIGARWMRERSSRLLRAAEQRMMASEHSAAKHALRLVSAQLRAVRRMAIAALDQAGRERTEREQINTEAKEAVAELEKYARDREEAVRREEKERADLAVALAEARARHAGEVQGMERAFGGIKQVYRAAGVNDAVAMGQRGEDEDRGAKGRGRGKVTGAGGKRGRTGRSADQKAAAPKASKPSRGRPARADSHDSESKASSGPSLPRRAVDAHGRRGSASSDASWHPEASGASTGSDAAPVEEVSEEAELAKKEKEGEREAELQYRAELKRQERKAARGKKAKGKAKQQRATSSSSTVSSASSGTKSATAKSAKSAVERAIDELPTPASSTASGSAGKSDAVAPSAAKGKVSRRKRAKQQQEGRAQAGSKKTAKLTAKKATSKPVQEGNKKASQKTAKSATSASSSSEPAVLFTADELADLASGALAASSSGATEPSPGSKRKRAEAEAAAARDAPSGAGSAQSAASSENSPPVDATGTAGTKADGVDGKPAAKRRRLRKAGGGVLTDASAQGTSSAAGTSAQGIKLAPGKQDIRMRAKAMAGPIVGFGKGGFKAPRLKPRQ